MVGANQTINHNSLHLNQTMYSIPSIIIDVSRQFFEYVGETNREKLHNRSVAYAFQNPIIDPSGTRDPFHYNIEKFYGASDHQVHLDWNPRIPAVQFGNWPDAVYHSSDDSPANPDPADETRRVLDDRRRERLATAGPAGRLPSRIRRCSSRTRALQRIWAMHEPDFVEHLHDDGDGYKEALNPCAWRTFAADRHSLRRPLAVGDKRAFASRRSNRHSPPPKRWTCSVQQAYTAKAKRLGVTVALTPTLTASEQAASKLVPTRKEQAAGGRGGGGGGGGGAGANPAPALTGYYAQEARNFADGVRSILDIRNAISAEFGPVKVDDVVRFFREGEAAGAYMITTK
jgi:hypothetical protein